MDLSITKQAIAERVKMEIEPFLSAVLQSVMQESLLNNSSLNKLTMFNRISIRDSTCAKVSKHLSEIFPGPHSKNGNAATLKIQHQFDLKTHQATHFKISHYRENDQSQSMSLLDQVEAGDLILEDLGYFKLAKFKEIGKRQAYFIGRIRKDISLYKDKKERLDLVNFLSSQPKSTKRLSRVIYIGGEQLAVRLIAIRLPKKMAQARKDKERKNRDRRRKLKTEDLKLCEWQILVTNIPDKDYDAQQIWELYSLRWRIENMFKCWKQQFNLAKLLGHKAVKNPNYILAIVYGFLIYLTKFILPSYQFWTQKVYEKKQLFLSFNKFVELLKHGENPIARARSSLKEKIDFLSRFSCHEHRHSRTCQLELLHHLLAKKALT